jgi:MYXO-CTERM domain-containing protein
MRVLSLAAALALVACAATDDATREPARSTSQSIINGTVSTPNQNFVVQLGMTANGEYAGACSAVMVAKNLVLTARHCVGALKDETSWEITDYPPAGLEVYYGADAPLRSDPANKQPGDAKGVKLFVPAANVMIPDIALVQLDRPIEAARIAKIRLDGGAQVNEILDVVGYGIDETSAAPSIRMQRKGVSVLGIGPILDSQRELFAGEFYFGEAACSGDSGGPALSATTGAVVGIASRVGNGTLPNEQNPAGFCVGAATEGIYTSLAPVKDLVLRAFQAAGAQPILENDPDPVPEAPAQPQSPAPSVDDGDDEDDGDDADDEPAKRTPKQAPPAASGCAMTTTGGTPGRGAFVLLAALLACARRRRAVTSITSARRCRSSFGCRRFASW